MMNNPQKRRSKPPVVTGVAHIFAAGSYSVSGLAKLWQETAFRHEVLLFVVSLVAFYLVGATAVEVLILFGLFFLLVAIEALNTAIECIVDHLSADWELYAKNSKDLGSLAVMCCLLGAGLFIAFVISSHGLF